MADNDKTGPTAPEDSKLTRTKRKWARVYRFLTGRQGAIACRPGFWEQNGYNMHGDPWSEERYA